MTSHHGGHKGIMRPGQINRSLHRSGLMIELLRQMPHAIRMKKNAFELILSHVS